MLTKIKLLLGISDTSKDALLTQLVEQATKEAINFTHNDDTDDYANAIIDMVVWKYNRLGTEGVNSEGYSGVTFNYASDYPVGVTTQLRACRKVRTI